MSHDVFISCASEDYDTADEVCLALEKRGIRCWMAKRDISPGVTYSKAIVEAIAASKLLLLLLTRESNKSPHVLNEVDRAVDSRTDVLPVRLMDVEPSTELQFYLSTKHWLVLEGTSLTRRMGEIVNTVAGCLDREPIAVGEVEGEDSKAPRTMVYVSIAAVLLFLGLLATLFFGDFFREAGGSVEDVISKESIVPNQPSADVLVPSIEPNITTDIHSDPSSRLTSGQERDVTLLLDSSSDVRDSLAGINALVIDSADQKPALGLDVVMEVRPLDSAVGEKDAFVASPRIAAEDVVIGDSRLGHDDTKGLVQSIVELGDRNPAASSNDKRKKIRKKDVKEPRKFFTRPSADGSE